MIGALARATMYNRILSNPALYRQYARYRAIENKMKQEQKNSIIDRFYGKLYDKSKHSKLAKLAFALMPGSGVWLYKKGLASKWTALADVISIIPIPIAKAGVLGKITGAVVRAERIAKTTRTAGALEKIITSSRKITPAVKTTTLELARSPIVRTGVKIGIGTAIAGYGIKKGLEETEKALGIDTPNKKAFFTIAVIVTFILVLLAFVRR